MVVIDGARGAQRLHRRAAEGLFPHKSIRAKKQLEEWFAKCELHYADMVDSEKLLAAKVLRMLSDRHPGYKKTKFHLASAVKHGLQIADFYAVQAESFY